MKITTKEIRQIIKEETAKVLEAYELTDLSPNYGSEMTDQERMMDQWTTDVTKELFDDILTDAAVDLPTGERENLDGFLAALGNMAITGGISGKEAMAMVRELGLAAEAAMSKVSQGFVDEDYIEDQKWESGERTSDAPDYYQRLEQDELAERKLTDAEEDKREEIAKAMEEDNPDMPMDKKMTIATAQAKKSA